MAHNEETRQMVVSGEKLDVTIPVLEIGDYIVRPAHVDDTGEIEQISRIDDPSLEENLTVGRIIEGNEQGYTFERGSKGLILFVAQHADGSIAGRAYLKTWHGDDFTKPKYKQNAAGGIDVITAQDMINGATNIVEFGGLLIDQDHRGHQLGKALLYLRTHFLDMMQRQDYAADFAFLTNVGLLRPEDNPQRVDYRQKLFDSFSEKAGVKIDLRNLESIAGRLSITPEEFSSIFQDLRFPWQGKDQEYFFGAPRVDTQAAFAIKQRLVDRRPLLLRGDVELYSPTVFFDSDAMHPNHGGNYTSASLKQFKS